MVSLFTSSLAASPESVTTFWGLTLGQWLILIAPIILGGSWLALYYTRKSNRNNMPRIIEVEYVDNASIDIVVLNPSQLKIAVENIYARRLILFHIPVRRLGTLWTHPIHPDDQHSRIPKSESSTQYGFTGQKLFHFAIPVSDLRFTNKVYVKTTRGRCSAILAPCRES